MTKDELIKVDQAVGELHDAQCLLAELQRAVMAGLPLGAGVPLNADRDKIWHALESIDDRINDALAKLGD